VEFTDFINFWLQTPRRFGTVESGRDIPS